jgi:hypothetical protein
MNTESLGSNTPKWVGQPEPRWFLLKYFGLFVLIFMLTFALLALIFLDYRNTVNLGVIHTTPVSTEVLVNPPLIREFPNTTDGIHVFNDQLATWEMSEEQFIFAATHYAGTQKIFASDARRLRARNPDFIVLNYRLGTGLGYQEISGECKPDGAWIQIIEGEKWVREFPENPPEDWFYHIDGQRVLSCDWGWYLMELTNESWRDYWAGEVLRQLRENKADGVFIDSLFPPNYFGGTKFSPNLPEKDQSFENTWSSNIEKFVSFTQSDELSKYHMIDNAGLWVTGRDNTDYSLSDGVMVEGFSRWVDGQYFSEMDGDWQLQMDRILNLVNLEKILLLQQYVDLKNDADRLFILGNYLLVKGNHTFINLEYSSSPEWFPEYEIPIGSPTGTIPTSISSLWRSDWQVYSRAYTNGLVLVNPSENEKKVELFQKYYQAIPFGGGIVPSDGKTPDWTIDYSEVTSVNLKPHQSVILLNQMPSK